MTREEALARLKFGLAADRIEAAVVLRTAGEPGDLGRVRRAVLREFDERVRAELMKTRIALEGLEDERGGTSPAPDDMSPGEMRADAYARAVQDTTFEIVHEMRRLVGFARDSAATDLTEFAGSRTEADFDRLSALLDAVERLGQVASVPLTEEFDLGGLVHDLASRLKRDSAREATQLEIVADAATDTGAKDHADPTIELLGPNPMLVAGDPGLVEIIVRNGLVNAVEACIGQSSQSSAPATVIVNWGVADRYTWLTIADNGPGIPADLKDPFKFAVSTKRAHLGVGLTITRRAVSSLAGEVRLVNRSRGGASFRAEWPHERDS